MNTVKMLNKKCSVDIDLPADLGHNVGAGGALP
jgi:hypothetical protein